MTPRLDAHLAALGLARSRTEAGRLIKAGSVTVDGEIVRKPSHLVTEHARLDIVDVGPRWVGRAAEKLLGALDEFPGLAAAVPGATCIDVGASTGGFTQVLLAHGADHVVALDVGHDQLAAPVAGDPRVTDQSGMNVRDIPARVSPSDLGGPFDVLVADLSFISLTLLGPALRALLRPGGAGMVLVKPQFEVGRERLGRDGVVHSVHQRRDAIVHVAEALTEAGLVPYGLARSPLRGHGSGRGNVEYLLWVGDPGGSAWAPERLAAAARQLTEEEAEDGTTDPSRGAPRA